jgi:CheY-like chemotaxis protein
VNDAAMPRVLLVEDDPTSRAFLAAAIKALPARVDEVDSVAAAVARATATRHDLWLVDAHLPDGTGHAVLRALRGLHPDTIALAHTASSESDVAASLRAAGFADVLVKPLSATTLQSAVRARLDVRPGDVPERPLWDDATAATALNGNTAHVQALRTLFADDLKQLRERVRNAAAREDHPGIESELHKLLASCGFVGAVRLGDAAAALRRAPGDAEQLAAFERIADETAAAFAWRTPASR